MDKIGKVKMWILMSKMLLKKKMKMIMENRWTMNAMMLKKQVENQKNLKPESLANQVETQQMKASLNLLFTGTERPRRMSSQSATSL